MKGRRFVLPVLLALLLGAPALGAAAPASPGRAQIPSLRELLRGWTRTTPLSPARPTVASEPPTRVDALAALAGGGGSLQRCATPLLLALHQHIQQLNQPTRVMLDRATLARPEGLSSVRMSPDGEFRIHYSIDPLSADRVDPRDDDADGVPDGVEHLAGEFTDAFADIVHVLDWAPAPAPEGTPQDRSPAGRRPAGPIDVVLAGLYGPSGGTEGFVAPLTAPWLPPAADRAPDEGSDAVIFLDAGFASVSAPSRHAVAHMLAHLVQMRESVHESPWWDESSASWIETRLAGNAAEIARSLRVPTPGRSRGLDDDLLGLTVEAFLWPHYLAGSSGLDIVIIRRIWEEMAAVPGNNTFDAMDRVARRILGSSLPEEIRVFNVWNLFLGQADDGGHYSFGSQLSTPQGDAIYDTFPARGASLSGPLLPLGSAMVRLLGDGSPGGLRIRFAGDDPGAWDVSALVYSARQPAQVRHVPVEMDDSGRGYITIPWRGLAVIDLLIQNLAAPPGAAADYAFTVEYDPVVPFDLLAFTADDSGSGAMLSWSTETEERLAGWNVLRGPGPLGPFSRVNQFLLPGAGRNNQPMSYVFVDSSAEPGRKYYYHLEGVTFEGFTEISYPAGVRLGRASGLPSTIH